MDEKKLKNVIVALLIVLCLLVGGCVGFFVVHWHPGRHSQWGQGTGGGSAGSAAGQTSTQPAQTPEDVQPPQDSGPTEEELEAERQKARAAAAAQAYLDKIGEYTQVAGLTPGAAAPDGGVYYSLVEARPYFASNNDSPYLVWNQGGRRESLRLSRGVTLLLAKYVDLNRNGLPELITGVYDSDAPGVVEVTYWGFDGNSICMLGEPAYIYGLTNESDDLGYDGVSLVEGDGQGSMHVTSYYEYYVYERTDFFVDVNGTTTFWEYHEPEFYDDGDISDNYVTHNYELNGHTVSAQAYDDAFRKASSGEEILLAETWGYDATAEDDTWFYFNPTDSPEGYLSKLPVSLYLDLPRETENTVEYLESLTR